MDVGVPGNLQKTRRQGERLHRSAEHLEMEAALFHLYRQHIIPVTFLCTSSSYKLNTVFNRLFEASRLQLPADDVDMI